MTDDEKVDNYEIYHLGKPRAEPYVVDMLVSEEILKMEVDTGAAMGVMNVDTYTLLKKETPRPRAQRLHMTEYLYRRASYSVGTAGDCSEVQKYM